jgi:hypothetical protein
VSITWAYNLFVPTQPGPTTKTVQRVCDVLQTHGYNLFNTEGNINGNTYAPGEPFADAFAVSTVAEAAALLGRDGGCLSFWAGDQYLEISLDCSGVLAAGWSPDPPAPPPISLIYIWGYGGYFHEYPPGGGYPIGPHFRRIEAMERLFVHLATTLDAHYGYLDHDNLTEYGPFTNMRESDVLALRAGGMPPTLWGIQYFADEYAEALPWDLMQELGATSEPLPHGRIVKCVDYTHTFDSLALEVLNVEWRKRTGQSDLPPGRRP